MQGLGEWAWCIEYWTCKSKSIHRQEQKPWGEVMFRNPSWGKMGENRSKPETRSGWSWPVAEKGTKLISVGVETGRTQRRGIGAGAEAGGSINRSIKCYEVCRSSLSPLCRGTKFATPKCLFGLQTILSWKQSRPQRLRKFWLSSKECE